MAIKTIEARKGKVYLCDWGRLYILDEQTGKVLAKNTEHNMGAAAVYIFDESDNLYTASYLAAVDKFDTNAKLLRTTDDKVWLEGLYWPKKMTFDGNNLVIDYGDEGVITLNKDTLEIIETKNNSPLNNNSAKTESEIRNLINQVNKDNFKKVEIGILNTNYDYTKKEFTDFQLAKKIIDASTGFKVEEINAKSISEMNYIILYYGDSSITLSYNLNENDITISTGKNMLFIR